MIEKQKLIDRTVDQIFDDRDYESPGEDVDDLYDLFNDVVDATYEKDPCYTMRWASTANQRLRIRHIPQILTVFTAHDTRVSHTVEPWIGGIVERPDELNVVLAAERQLMDVDPSPRLMRGAREIIEAPKFSPEQLASYQRRDADISLKDVIEWCQPIPRHPGVFEAIRKIQFGDDPTEPGISPLEEKEEYKNRPPDHIRVEMAKEIDPNDV